MGGLAALLVLVRPHRGLLVAVLPRFSHVATACIAAVMVTGTLTTAIHIAAGHGTVHSGGGPGAWEAGLGSLAGTAWGQILLAKCAALVVIGALGWLTRRRMAMSRTPLLRWAGYEVALMAVALGLAATLSQAPS